MVKKNGECLQSWPFSGIVGFFHHDVMPKGVFSIFEKDPLLIYDLVIFITVVYLIILLLLNNLVKLQTKLLSTVTYLV
jgi:hypothetical protein